MALAFAWAGPALSAPDPLAAARKAMAEGEFETALKSVDAALPRTKELSVRVRLQLLRGQALAALDRKDKAIDAFAAALALDAAAELDSATASPTVLDLFEKARSRVNGTLAVSTSVKGALVRIDDTAHGPAPLTVELPVGRHRVEAASEGFR
ncbi:MAG: PEGA domain-containing protein, partial [Myxococcota bacterium]